MTTTKLLFLIALISILLILVAPLTNVFAISSTNQTSSNQTNNLLKQLIKIENTTQVLQQDNANVLATKLDIIKVELERILVQLQAPPTLPPSSFLVPPPPFNGTTCKEQNDNGVLIECPAPVFPSGILPPLPTPPPIPPSTAIPLPPISDCIDTVYGVFCPTN